MEVTNRGTRTEYVTTKDDKIALAAGETKNIAVLNRDSTANRAREHAGVLVFGKAEKAPAAPAAAGTSGVKAS